MKRILLTSLAAAGALALAGATSSVAAPASSGLGAISIDVPVETVQYRYYGGPRHYGHRYYGRPYHGRHYGYRRGYDRGAAAAAGVAGLAAGALIAGAIANSQARAAEETVVIDDPAWEARCAARYKSFDPVSGTFLGYDGIRRPCNL